MRPRPPARQKTPDFGRAERLVPAVRTMQTLAAYDPNNCGPFGFLNTLAWVTDTQHRCGYGLQFGKFLGKTFTVGENVQEGSGYQVVM